MIEIVALTGLPEIMPGDDLAALLAEAMAAGKIMPMAGDVIVIAQKIVSKAEGRFAALADVRPGAEAARIAAATGKDARFVELVLRESSAVIRIAPNLLITRHRSGHVMANAGIDQSNIGAGGDENVLLLPADPDRSAHLLRRGLGERLNPAPAVIVADSFGRPWRLGTVNVAIGASGLPSLWDRRGERDRDGRELKMTQIALADMIASAAGLAMGEGAEGIPAALVRGFVPAGPDLPAARLVRPLDEDLFR